MSLDEPTEELGDARVQSRFAALHHLNQAALLLTGGGAALFYAITTDTTLPLVGGLGDEHELKALRQQLRALLEALDEHDSTPR